MIKEFQGKYRWLSNFWPCDVDLYEETYPSVEHAYQSAKSNSIFWKNYCQKTPNPGKVKRESTKVHLIDNWNTKRVDIMRELIDKKFNKDPFMSLLIDTKGIYLQEGNKWNDTFWGVDLDTDKGKNILGRLIMEKRDMLLLKNNKGLLFDIMEGNC